ncbi:hypothetical protein XENOCAPTIV_023120 [Xenoophorus captivus]|uniref:Uncharacterized protein n=1 Tax=Xenoophorus captivus TaxID=1517983 RepID=A0ABV0RIL8_9TELE
MLSATVIMDTREKELFAAGESWEQQGFIQTRIKDAGTKKSGFGNASRHSLEPLKTQNRSYDCNSSLHVGHKCSNYIIKYVKHVQKICENLFVQTHWNKCPVTLLYSICRNLYVIVC